MSEDKRVLPLNSKGKSLLVGNIYCAHCGNRLTLTTSGRNKRMPGCLMEQYKKKCGHGINVIIMSGILASATVNQVIR